jgi:hypothetical protein
LLIKSFSDLSENKNDKKSINIKLNVLFSKEFFVYLIF